MYHFFHVEEFSDTPLSLLRRPALLRTVPETSSLNMVSTRQRACPKKTVATQREGLPRNVAVQVSGYRQCQSLLLPREDEKERKDEERIRLREVERKQTDDLSVLKGCFEEFQGRPTALEKEGGGMSTHLEVSVINKQTAMMTTKKMKKTTSEVLLRPPFVHTGFAAALHPVTALWL